VYGLTDEPRLDDFESFLSHVHPDDVERHKAIVLKSLDPSANGHFADVYRWIRPDGNVRWISISGKFRFSEVNGVRQPVMLAGTAMDITETKEAQAALQRSRSELRALIEKLPMGIFVERDGEILYANPTLASYLGYRDPAELAGVRPEDLLAPVDREVGQRYVQRSEECPDESLPPREWRFTRRDGRVVTLESSVTRGIEFDGQPAILCTVRDLTDIKVMQAQLMQSDRLASVGMLAAGVAHEINNPLAYLIAALEFLAQEMKGVVAKLPGAGATELLEALAEAREGAARVKHVVRDLKTFSRADNERRAKMELRPVIESSLNMAFNEIKYRARVVKEYGRAPPVLANEARLGQVFLNLFVNAAHAIPEGHVEENEIRVVTGTDALGRPVVEVRDSGSGIAPDVLPHIFDPFFTTKPMGVGTGLGLAICQNIIGALGGELTVESEVGEGTAFRMVLPPAPLELEDESRTEPEPGPSMKGRRGRVLVVDDEPALCAALRRVLAPEHEVAAVTEAHAARDRIARGERFDVILCDLMMPGMTGMELHAELSELAPDQAARMVLLTGGAFTPSADEFLRRVANARVEKPFDPASLRALVRGLVS
jgi:PAS domain S-box-containing protein